jgi:hypothetical protein
VGRVARRRCDVFEHSVAHESVEVHHQASAAESLETRSPRPASGCSRNGRCLTASRNDPRPCCHPANVISEHISRPGAGVVGNAPPRP